MLTGKNKGKMGKKALCLVFAFLLSIESMAAVVSDNDGSAFLTKNEFEAMKEEFEKQIKKYNDSLDNKIDGAIASYLAGIRLSEQPENLYDSIKNAIGQDLIFAKGVKTTTATLSNELNMSCMNRYYVKTNITPDTDFETWLRYPVKEDPTRPDVEVYTRAAAKVIPNALNYNGGYATWNFDECRDITHLQNTSGTSYWLPTAQTGGFMLTTGQAWERGNSSGYGSSMYTNETYNPIIKVKNQNVQTIESDGSGSVYTFALVSGQRVLDEYASSYWPMLRGSATWHSYGNFHATTLANYRAYHETNNGMRLSTVQTANTGVGTGWGTITWGTSVGEESETTGYWGTATYALCKNTDGIDYSTYQWGTGTNIDIYANPNDQAVTISTSKSTFTFNNSTYEREMYDPSDLTKMTQTNDLPANKLEYYLPSITPVAYKLNTFTNNYLSAVAGETVYMGGGMPIIRTTDSDQRIRIRFTTNTTGPSTNKVKVIISDKQFVDGNLAPGALELYSNDCNPGTSYEATIDIAGKNQVVWMNLYDTNTTSNYNANLGEFGLQVV